VTNRQEVAGFWNCVVIPFAISGGTDQDVRNAFEKKFTEGAVSDPKLILRLSASSRAVGTRRIWSSDSPT